jgi:SNF2 family DNA or RNA helicase
MMILQGEDSQHLPGFLFPFQRQDVFKLRDRKAVLIANEMGTGKTYEAVALDLIHRDEWGRTKTLQQRSKALTLVVAPLTVLVTWQEHFNTLAPHLKTFTMDARDRGAFLRDLSAELSDVYIVHWDALRLIKSELKAKWFLHIIADEVHRIKNRKAQQTQALKIVRGTFRSGLSGTPITNKPNDIWSILDWLYPRAFGSYWKFYERYVNYEIIYPQGYHKILGPKNEGELRAEMDSFFVRRKKVEVLKDLPDKYYSRLVVDLDPKQRRAYDQMRKEMVAWLEQQDKTRPLVAPVVIAQLIRLQQLAAAYVGFDQSAKQTSVVLIEPSSKLDALMQIVEDNPNESIVVFSQFRQLIDLAESRLVGAGTSSVKITGDVSGLDRSAAVARFQSGQARIFLGTIAAGGEGITLTRSSTVVFLDRDWSPARNSQAEDRLHRIGQKEAVEVIDIVAKNTVDLGRFAKLELKKEWIRKLLD